jgi:aspartyl-tRNA(Asn)/glutamyl-tRNA(Gln) amidotransferase subunit A
VPSRDGTVAERLRRAGAIIIGKTNMPEFAAWPRSKNRIAGESVNPWDAKRISGASSGGSAAAVVAGMVPLAVGSDGGGSTRIPSALCGAVGLYPSPGRVPSYGSFSYTPAGSMGPIGREVADVALMQHVIAGPDRRDAAAMTEQAPEVLSGLDSGVQGLRVVWSSDFGRIPVDARVAAVAAEAVNALSSAGVTIDETEAVLEHPWGEAIATTANQDAVAAAGWPAEVPYDEGDIPDLSAEEEWMWEVFKDTVPFTASPPFQRLRDRYVHLLCPPAQLAETRPAPAAAGAPSADSLRRSMEALLSDRDILCSPTMAVTAPVAPDGWGTAYADGYMGTNFTFIANALGCAAISVPCGLVDGLPVGLQFIGRSGDEAKVLRLARAIEVIRPFRTLPDDPHQ